MHEETAPEVPRRTEGFWTPRGVSLLEVDPDLGAELPEEELAQARRQVVLPTVALERGIWEVEQLSQASGVRGEPRGFLVLSGAVTADLAIAGQVCTRLLTPLELVLVDGWDLDTIPVRVGWTALDPAVVAVLDERLALVGMHWPGLMTAILKRAAQQVRHALLQQAISQLPRVEDRLLALMWSIADRQGVVRTDGVWIHLPVTHATLAQMIGARRPTVSLGLRALSDGDMVLAEGTGWLLSRRSLQLFPQPAATPDIAR